MLFFTLIFLWALTFIDCKSLPENIKRCAKSDPNFNQCLEVNILDGYHKFKAGSKEYGINKLEPFFVQKLDLGNQSSGSISISQRYENVYLYGMTNSSVSNMTASFSGDDCFWRFDAVTPVLRMDADYHITGQVLVFPINGHGNCSNILYDLKVTHDMKCERYKKKEKTHLRILSYRFEMEPKSVVFDFKNIVDGNEQLSREINKTINENSLAVYADVKQGFADSFSLIYKNVGNNFFARVPENELFLP